MTAKRVIEEIKALDPQGRAGVPGLLRELEAEQGAATVSEEKFQLAADSVFSRHHELLRKLAQ